MEQYKTGCTRGKLTDCDNEKSKIKYQILMMAMPMLMMFSIIYSQKNGMT